MMCGAMPRPALVGAGSGAVGRWLRQHPVAAGPHQSATHHRVAAMALRAVPHSTDAAVGATTTSLPPVPHGAHRVVLMRHGESEFNNANIFTGWCDVALTRRGVVEAIEAGQVLHSHRLGFRRCYTSLLTRSIVTAQRALEAAGAAYTPLHMDW